MKSLRFLLISLALIFCASGAKAEFRYAATAGANYSSLKFKQDLAPIDHVAGPRAGVTGELMFPGIGIGLRLGAFYSMKGAKADLGQRKIWYIDGFRNQSLYMHTLEIPVNLEFKWTRMNGIEDYIAPLVFGGPVFDFTIAHSKCSAMEYPLGSIALRAGGGFQLFKRWQLTAAYTWGMTYAIKAVKLENFSAQNRYWNVSLSYFF